MGAGRLTIDANVQRDQPAGERLYEWGDASAIQARNGGKRASTTLVTLIAVKEMAISALWYHLCGAEPRSFTHRLGRAVSERAGSSPNDTHCRGVVDDLRRGGLLEERDECRRDEVERRDVDRRLVREVLPWTPASAIVFAPPQSEAHTWPTADPFEPKQHHWASLLSILAYATGCQQVRG